MKPICVYVAGPLTKGDLLRNVRAAVIEGAALRDAGLVPFVPHLSALWDLIAPAPYEEWMRMDLAWIERCDALLRMPGESSGADREVAHARSHGVPVFFDRQALYAWTTTLDAP